MGNCIVHQRRSSDSNCLIEEESRALSIPKPLLSDYTIEDISEEVVEASDLDMFIWCSSSATEKVISGRFLDSLGMAA